MHLDGGVQGGMQLRWWFEILFGVLVDFRKIDGWVSWRGLLRSSVGGALGGAGAQALLSGVYAGAIFWGFQRDNKRTPLPF